MQERRKEEANYTQISAQPYMLNKADESQLELLSYFPKLAEKPVKQPRAHSVT